MACKLKSGNGLLIDVSVFESIGMIQLNKHLIAQPLLGGHCSKKQLNNSASVNS